MNPTPELEARIATAKILRNAAIEREDWPSALAHGRTMARLQCERYEALTGQPDPFREVYAAFERLMGEFE